MKVLQILRINIKKLIFKKKMKFKSKKSITYLIYQHFLIN